MARLLVVEDEVGLRRGLTINLRARGFEVEAVESGAAALRSAATQPPDLIILDLGLPDLDGLQVITGVRVKQRLPIIVLSARSEQREKVQALDAGADDYVTKPFGMDELVARVRAALRRVEPAESPETTVATAAFSLDLAAKRATRHGVEVKLTPTEWHLVEVLVRQPGTLVPSSTLLAEVWGAGYAKETNYLRVYFAQLRRKLEDSPSQPRHFITEHGMGYRFDP